MKKLFLLTLLVSTSSFADTIIFQCTTTNNQQVNITKGVNHLTYRFGKTIEEPELNIKVPNSSSNFVVYPQWSELALKHKSFTYEVNSTYTQKVKVQILVKEKGKKTITYQCNTSKANYINLLTDEYDLI